MKKIIILLALILNITVNAQAPNGFNYQATVRNSSGALITNQNVLFKFNIMLNSQTSLPVYSETHFAPTDDLGQVNLVLGQGTATIGAFSSINWGNGTYFLGIELNTGSGYVAMGTTQLLSVPYALYANSAGSTISSSAGFTHFVGESYGGGIIYHLWKDNQGAEHGLIVDIYSLGISNWSNITNQEIGANAQSRWDGYNNSLAIVNQSGHTNSAALLCLNSNNSGYSDWYLPSIDELNLLWQNRFNVNKSLSFIDGSNEISDFSHWSSTENTMEYSWAIDYYSAVANYYRPGCNQKVETGYVRAIRAF